MRAASLKTMRKISEARASTRQTDAKLSASLVDQERPHAVNTDGREQRGAGRETR